MFGWIKTAIGFGLQLYGYITGKPNPDLLTDILPQAISQLLPMIKNAINYQGLDSKEKFDSWLETLDTSTGTDPGAVQLIPHMPAKFEEEFFDGLKQAAKAYGYMLLKVPEYYEE